MYRGPLIFSLWFEGHIGLLSKLLENAEKRRYNKSPTEKLHDMLLGFFAPHEMLQ
jgi:hypothetical protein